MDTVAGTCFKIGLLAISARWWVPLVKEVILQVRNAADESGPSTPSPILMDPENARTLYDDAGNSVWSKRRRVNRRWDNGR